MSEKLNSTVKTRELLEAVKIVENFISRKKFGEEHLKAIYFRANKRNNTLTLRTTDSKMSAGVKITGSINNDWETAVSCRAFKDLIKGIPEREVEFIIEKDKMVIQTPNSKNVIRLMEGLKFPTHEIPDSTKYYMVSRLKLKALLENVMFSASNDTENGAVNCIRLEATDDGRLKAIGTDTYRMSCGEIGLINYRNAQPEGNLSVSVPLKEIAGVVKAAKARLGAPVESVSVSCERDRISFKFDYAGIEIVSDLVSLEFPDYKTVIGNLNADKKVILNTKDFLAVLKRAHSVAKNCKEAKNGAIFDFERNKLTIRTFDEHSEFKEEMMTIQNGGNLKISLNVKFLIDFISKVKEKTVLLEMLNNRSAVLVKGETDGSWVYLTMPLALRES